MAKLEAGTFEVDGARVRWERDFWYGKEISVSVHYAEDLEQLGILC